MNVGKKLLEFLGNLFQHMVLSVGIKGENGNAVTIVIFWLKVRSLTYLIEGPNCL